MCNKNEYSENYEKELYCWDCDKWTNTREQMQAHIVSVNHLRNASKVQRFECKLCLVQTSAIFSSVGALVPGPCGGPPKTIRQRNIILNHSVVGEGGGGGG